MRLLILPAIASLLAGCVANAPVAPRPAPVATCTAETVVDAGRYGTLLPSACNAGDPRTRERYAIGRQIAQVDAELARVNYINASRDGRRRFGSGGVYRGFAGRGQLIARQVELKGIRRNLRRQAGISS
jgi:hypothetical protein